MADIAEATVEKAQEGDAQALEALVHGVQDNVYRLATRMLADPEAAQDATQEILIRIITKLSTFEGNSKFETWTYRVATNYLLTAKKMLARDPGLSFPVFADDLLDGLVDETHAAPEDHVMINELRVRCTMAMLLCLDLEHRAAYVLGEVFEFDHSQASEILQISSTNYRKRLSRARKSIQEFTAATCGLTGQNTPCTCSRRLPAAIAQGRIGNTPTNALAGSPKYDAIRLEAKQLEANLVAAKLQRATGPLRATKDFAKSVIGLVTLPND